MAGKAVARVAALLALAAVVQALTIDEEAATNVVSTAGSVQDSGELAILLRGPHSRNRREELLHIKGEDDTSISLYFMRKSNKVSLESLNDGHLKSVSWGLGSHARTTLLLVVSPSRVKLFVGCHSLHSHDMPARHNLLRVMASRRLKLYHEENAPVEVFSSERAALESLGCHIDEVIEVKPPTVMSEESDVEDVKEFVAKEARRKREEMQGDDYRTNYIDSGVLPTPPARGDIPANAIETCDDEVIRQLQFLNKRVEQLLREVGDQKGVIDGLRAQLQQCCHRPPVERCTGSTCYPGY